MDYPDIVQWVTDHKGGFEKPIYKTALSHAQQIWFEGEFEVGLQLLSFPEVQQAVATYWDRALTKYDYRRCACTGLDGPGRGYPVGPASAAPPGDGPV
ncbi:hypothetical protein BN427_4980 [Klebsiella pneumoniae subsp. pneumoniae ST258-K28BO]|nr:hypothetical protein BN427_4980 [Klebsiella pneumoniae subsp. pneumoniae ST258-K28BO]